MARPPGSPRRPRSEATAANRRRWSTCPCAGTRGLPTPSVAANGAVGCPSVRRWRVDPPSWLTTATSSASQACTRSSSRVTTSLAGRRAASPTSSRTGPRALREHWVPDVELSLSYIVCASRTASSRILCERLRDLLRHGAGEISNSWPHKGGERVWQCRGWATLQLAWKVTGPYPTPHDTEVAIGKRFSSITGSLPFANVRP